MGRALSSMAPDSENSPTLLSLFTLRSLNIHVISLTLSGATRDDVTTSDGNNRILKGMS